MTIRRYSDKSGETTGYLFWCPGCDEPHGINITSPTGARWTFNGNEDSPTFSPSILVHEINNENFHHPRCHSFVTDGMIQFLGDCTHKLANQTVPIPSWDKSVGCDYHVADGKNSGN